MILTDIKTRFDIVFPGDMVESGVELATVGSIIFTVQPFYHPLANLASMQLAATRMFSSVKTISPNILISLINEEADRQKVQKSRRNEGGEGKPEEKDETLFFGSNFGACP